MSRAELRVLRAIGTGSARMAAGDDAAAVVLAGDGWQMRAARDVLRRLAGAGLLIRAAAGLRLSAEATALVRRLDSPDDPFRAQHMDVELRQTDTPDGAVLAKVNLGESPLALLTRQRTRDGKTFLAACEFDAGERLRRDFTRAGMMPRLGADWSRPIASGRRAGGTADMADGAIAARLRVERALDAAGPELSGVLIDVCCFLKGLGVVEHERGWPVRSAKLMLKAALGCLSRHYDPPPRSSTPRRSMQFWGADGFRPTAG